MDKVGILAGKGVLPLEVARGIKENGLEPVIVGLKEEVDPYLAEAGFTLTQISLGELGKILTFFLHEGVNRIVLAGRVGKGALFSDLQLDQDFQYILGKLTIKNTDAILLAIVNYLEERGIKVETQTKYLQTLLPQIGLLSGNPLNSREMEDLRYGFKLAKEIGRLDIGQSVIVKNGVVIAIEAIEGTDRTILRGGEFGGEGTVVVKVAKPNQDLRFDVPAIGLDTLNTLLQVKARALVIEAGLTIILNKNEVITKAGEHGLSIVAVDENYNIDKGL